MDSRWWMASGGIALLAGGYLAGTFHPRSGSDSGGAGTGGRFRSDGTARHDGRNSEVARARPERRSGPDSVPGFRPAVPFGPGGAREWFLATARENHEESIVGFFQLVQHCTTLDEHSALELSAELVEMLKLYRDGDPEMRAAFNGDDLPERSLRAAIFRLSQLNPEAAIRFVEENPGIRERGVLDEIIFTNYALLDPEKAGERLLQMSDDQRRGAIEGAMAALTGKDPEAALALISRFEQASVDNERRKLVERIVAGDPQKAIAFAREMVNAGRTPEVFASLVSAWIKKDESAALAWASDYQGPGELGVKDVLLRRSVSADPWKAAASYQALGLQADALAETGHVLGGALAGLDLPAAAEWASGLSPGSGRDSAEHAILDVWLNKDPLDASHWIREMPAGKSRDAALVKLVRAMTRSHPEEALEWTASIADPESRESLSREVQKSIGTREPGAGEEGEMLPELPGK